MNPTLGKSRAKPGAGLHVDMPLATAASVLIAACQLARPAESDRPGHVVTQNVNTVSVLRSPGNPALGAANEEGLAVDS
ncbi:MAG: hypothetical protein HKN70_02800, partial [Gammaproteobacteria bacterium]|nr:hypothetical protein [Gammaproteobacteria bacterium]